MSFIHGHALAVFCNVNLNMPLPLRSDVVGFNINGFALSLSVDLSKYSKTYVSGHL